MAEENNNNVGEIAGSIKAGLSPTRGMTRTSTSTVASLSSSFQSNISQNQQGFDDLIESNASFSSSVESFAETLKKVSEMNRKEFNDQRTALVKAIEEMKQAGGEDNKELVEKLTEGLQDKAMGTEGGRLRSMYDTGMSKMKEASNVDQDAGFVEGMKQAFSPERMFPKLFGKDFQASQATTGVKVKGSIGFGSGVDRETPAEKQTELLQDILESLHRIEGNGGMAGGGGGLGLPSRKPNLRRGKNPPKTTPKTTPKATPQTKAPSKPPVQPPKPPVQPPKPSLAQKAGDGGKKLLSNAKGLGKGLARGAKFIPGVGLLAAAGMGVYDGIQGAGNAAETFGLEEGEEASFGQKAAGAAGGVLSGLTFGLADGDKMAKGLYGFFGGDDDSPEEMQKRGMEIPSATDGAQLSEEGQAAVDALKGDGVPEVNPETGKRGMVIGDTPTAKPSVAEEGAAMLANKPGEGNSQAQQMLEKLKAGTTNVTPTTTGKATPAKGKGTASDIDMDAYGKAFDQIKEKEAELEAIGDLSGAGQREMNSPEFKEKRERQKALKAEIAQLFKEMDAAMGETPEKEAAFDAALEGDGSFDALLDADDDDFYAETPVKGNAKVTTTRTETGGGSITTFADKKVDTEESKALRAEAESVEGQKDALIQQMKDSGLQGGALLDAMMDSPEYQDLQLKVKQLKAAAEAAMGSLPQDPIIEAGKNVSSTIVEGATADAAQGQAPTIINNNQSAPPAAPQKQAPVIVTTPIGVRNNDSSARDNASRVW